MHSHKNKKGYSLVEVLMATGILAAALVAASSLSMATAAIDDGAQIRNAAMHYLENYARVWRLGVSNPAVLLQPCYNVDGSAVTISMVTTTPPTSVSFAGLGLEAITFTVSFLTVEGQAEASTSSITAYRTPNPV